jgi:hypothetical protein
MTSEDIREMLEAATPGPWRIGSWGDNVFGTGPKDEWLTICRVKRDDAPIEETRDAVDARLIAAAPDLAAEVLRLREQAAFRDEADALLAHSRNAELEALRAEVERLRGSLTDIGELPTVYAEQGIWIARAALGDSHD